MALLHMQEPDWARMFRGFGPAKRIHRFTQTKKWAQIVFRALLQEAKQEEKMKP